MKSGYVLVLVLLWILFLEGCERNSGASNQNPVFCTEIARIPFVPVKILDKTTGNNLIFGANAKFKVNQIQVISSQNGLGPFVDSINGAVELIGGGYQTPETVSLTLPGYSTDNFIITTASDGNPCPQPLISQVVLNGKTLCNPCSNYTVTLLK